MELQTLIDQNPWWRSPAALASDPTLKQFDRARVKWRPRLTAQLDLERDCIYTLRGPRQVGKTTLLKLMVRNLLEQGKVNPTAVFYFTCDLVTNGQKLVELVTAYLDFSQNLGSTRRRYLFLDEISSVQAWEKGVKYLVDTGRLANTSLVLTGSHALELKHAQERLPGRRGQGDGPLNKLLLPMKFSEFVMAVAPELAGEITDALALKEGERHAPLFELFQGRLPPVVERLQLFRKDLRQLLESYLLTGGIIRAVNDYYRRDTIDANTYEIYLHTLVGDLARWRYQERLARQIVGAVIPRMTSSVSLNGLAKENEIGSHNTVSKYLEALEETFVLFTLYQLEQHRELAAYRRSRKVYFQDPFIYHALRGWVMGRTDYFEFAREALLDLEHRSRLAEMVVAGHLAWLTYELQPSDFFTPSTRLFYWKKKGSQREVDFVVRYKSERYPIEVKYKRQVKRGDLLNLLSFGRGLVVTERTLEVHHRYASIPLELFLMLV